MNSSYAESGQQQQNRRRAFDQNDFELDQEIQLPPHLRQGSSSSYAPRINQYGDYTSGGSFA